jgi:hypothetical protein
MQRASHTQAPATPLFRPPCRFGLPGEALLSGGEDEAPGAGLLPQLEVTLSSQCNTGCAEDAAAAHVILLPLHAAAQVTPCPVIRGAIYCLSIVALVQLKTRV